MTITNKEKNKNLSKQDTKCSPAHRKVNKFIQQKSRRCSFDRSLVLIDIKRAVYNLKIDYGNAG